MFLINKAAMDTSAIRNLLSKLDYDWFKKKSDFFLKEGLYDKERKKILESFEETDYVQVDDDKWEDVEREIVVNIDLDKYCWNSFFYGSLSYGMNLDDMPPEFPIDAKDVADEVVEFINKKVEKFTDVTAINTVIEAAVEAVKNETTNLQKSVPVVEYSKALDYFVINTRKEISAEFQHIKEQLRLNKQSSSIDRKLTPEICTKIANFRLGNKKFITTVEGGLDEGAALLYLLNPKSDKKVGIKIRAEDWKNNDVYYLLSRLSDILTDRISFAAIEKKKTLLLKTGKFFTRSIFDAFKSQKLDAYGSKPDKAAIDEQLAPLFQ